MATSDPCSRADHDRCKASYCRCPCHPDENGVIHTGQWLREHLVKAADDWVDEALCASLKHPDEWFPEAGGRDGTPQERNIYLAAKRVCARCPVRRECLTAGLALENRTNARLSGGIWGGLNWKERWKAGVRDLPLRQRIDVLCETFDQQRYKLLSAKELKEEAS